MIKVGPVQMSEFLKFLYRVILRGDNNYVIDEKVVKYHLSNPSELVWMIKD